MVFFKINRRIKQWMLLLCITIIGSSVYAQKHDSIQSANIVEKAKTIITDSPKLAYKLFHYASSLDTLNMQAHYYMAHLDYHEGYLNDFKKRYDLVSEYYTKRYVEKDTIYQYLNLLMGLHEEYYERYDEAIEFLSKAIDFERKCWDCYIVRYRVNFKLKEYELVKTDILNALLIKPNKLEHYKDLALVYVFIDEFEQALEYFEIAKSTLKRQEDLTYYSICLSRARQHSEAIAIHENYISDYSEIDSVAQLWLFYHLGFSYSLIDDFESSVSYLEKYFNLKNITGFDYFLDDYSIFIINLWLNGEKQRAFDVLLEQMNSNPNEGRYDYLMAIQNIENKDTVTAFKNLQLATLKGTNIVDSLEFYSKVSQALYTINRLHEAVEVLEKVIESIPALEWQLNNLYFHDEMYSQRLFRRLANLKDYYNGNPEKQAFIYSLYARQLYQLKDYNDALNHINNAIALDQFDDYYVLRALIYFDKNMSLRDDPKIDSSIYQLVINDLEQAMADSSRKKDILAVKAMLQLTIGKYSEACSSAQEAKKYGARISQELIEHICVSQGNKDIDIEWDFFYDFVEFNDKFYK